MGQWESTVEGVAVNQEFWRDKRVLVTGHTGFKGAWLAIWLRRLGARVAGLSLPPTNGDCLFNAASVDEIITSRFCDIRDSAACSDVLVGFEPEIVFHLAAQALVRASYRDPVGTFAVNVQGTINVLEALRRIASVRAAVIVTTDKVYENGGQIFPYREIDPLGGHDPYSASKAASELAIASYRSSFLAAAGVAVASARAGNVIGGGDWSDDRLIPDAIRAWSQGVPLTVRHGSSVRPWQHVLEPLGGYIALAERLWDRPELAGAFNFGPDSRDARTVREVVEIARRAYGAAEVVWYEDAAGPKEATYLALETVKSRAVLEVVPRWPLAKAVERTIGWYRRRLDGEDARLLCHEEIAMYEASCIGDGD